MKTKYINYYSVGSTNDVAIAEIKKINEINAPVVVTSQIQTEGRGRNNKVWFGGSSNLYYTFAIKHPIYAIPIHFMQVIGGLAAYKTLSKIIDRSIIRLKYPNDIYVFQDSYKKIAGIISEHIYSYDNICTSIIGIGINNKQTEFPDNLNAISLYNIGINVKNDYLIQELTKHIIKLMKTDTKTILELWKSKLNLNNKKIRIIDNQTGEQINDDFVLDSILEDCRLLVVDTENNSRIIDNGDSIIYDLA